MADYVTVQLTPEAREAIRRHQLEYAATAGRRLTMAEVVLAAFELADRHADEVPTLTTLTKGSET